MEGNDKHKLQDVGYHWGRRKERELRGGREVNRSQSLGRSCLLVWPVPN